MVSAGWMHGYMRMYWAKKILEWTAVGRRGVRHRGAFERSIPARWPRPKRLRQHRVGDWGKTRPAVAAATVYGTVRSMSYASTVRKFDAERYIANVNEI
jgi:deoxyribodipyrimidine photo-lyase